MGFIERILQERAETARRAAQKKQQEEKTQKNIIETNDTLRLRSLDYFLQSTYPKLFFDLRILEPDCGVAISDFKEEEWVRKGGPKADWIHVSDHSPYVGSPHSELFAHVSWHSGGTGYYPYLMIICNPNGEIHCGGQTMKYETWKNNPILQEKTFEKAYRNPWYPDRGEER